MNHKDKVALITGGTKGIGLAIVQAFLKAGIRVCFTGRTQGSIDQCISKLNVDPDKIMGIAVDVRDQSGMQSIIEKCLSKWQKIDIVIANAGIGHFASIDELSYEQWNEVIDVNLTGVFNTVKPVISSLKESKGYIITIASLAGGNFFAKGTAYNASKFGLVGFTQAMMLDLRQFGIKVSTIMPGSVSTYFNGRTPSEADSWKIQPEDISDIVMSLLDMPAHTLPSKVEVRPTIPPSK